MNQRRPDLYLHEQVLLLALRDEKGTVESRAGWYSLAMGGAILSELLLAGRIAVSEGKKDLVDLTDPAPLHEPQLDECLDLVANAKRRRSATRWVQKFAGLKRLRHRIAEGLCRRGILKDSEDRILLLFTRKAYPTVDPGPERRLLEALREAIFGDSDHVDPRTTILASVADATGLLRPHFGKKELKAAKPRLEQLANGDLASAATRAAVQAAVVAAMAAVSTAVTISTATSARR